MNTLSKKLLVIIMTFFLVSHGQLVFAADSATNSVIINQGNLYTNSPKLLLSSSYLGAKTMMVSEEPSFNESKWLPYTSSRLYVVSEGEGLKTVYVKFRDGVLNESSVYTDSIYLDTNIPNGYSVTINNGDSVTFDPLINMSLTILDESPIQMNISESAEFVDSQWVDFMPVFPFELNGSVGEKTIYVKFRDAAGNESPITSDSIFLDTSSQTDGTFVINNGTAYTNSQNVALQFESTNAAYVMISEDSNLSDAVWRPYQTTVSFAVTTGDGLKTVYAKLKDNSGKISLVASDSIILDTAPPIISQLEINRGNLSTNNRIVQVGLEVFEADEMMLSESKDFVKAVWIPYNSKFSYKLSEGDGTKLIYAKFKDLTGNVSNPTSSSIEYDTTAPFITDFKINNGDESVNQQLVTLALDVAGATEMIFSEQNDFSDALWRKYTSSPTFSISKGEGTKTIYAKFRDSAANESLIISDQILYDLAGPSELLIFINNDTAYTKSNNVEITLNALDAKDVIISESISFDGDNWQPYSSNKNFNLSSGDGNKTVYVKFRDQSGNETFTISDDIILDTVSPALGQITINHGDRYTTTRNLDLELFAQDTARLEMMISESNDFGEAYWDTYDNQKVLLISKTDGEKTIYVKFRDAAGNESTVVKDSIILDTFEPSNVAVIINTGDYYTNKTSVNLDLNAEDANLIETMISETPLFAGAKWEAYSVVRTWSLTNGDGEKTVYVKYRDGAGNESISVSDSIILDTIAPSDTTIMINNDTVYTNKPGVSLSLTATDVHSVEMMVSEDPLFTGSKWTDFSSTSTWSLSKGDEEKTVYVKYRDAAGNESISVSDRITLDTVAPSDTTITINNDEVYTNKPGVSLSLTATDVHSIEMMVSEDPLFTGSKWEDFSSTSTWNLSKGDEEKTVYVKYRDAAGNEATVSDRIILDTTAPTNTTIMINNDAVYTNKPVVILSLTATDVHSIEMMISEDPLFTGSKWEDFSSTSTWNLSKGDEEKTAYVKYRVAAGNESISVSDSIILDTIAPNETTITINDHDIYSNKQDVTLSLTATDVHSIEMIVSEDPLFANVVWEAFSSSLNSTLSEANGEKVVYVKYRDAAGNETLVSDSIILDTVNPTITYNNNHGIYTIDQIIAITCTAADELSGVASDTCEDIIGPAYTFDLGEHVYNADVDDYAGNYGMGTTEFMVEVTFESLRSLTNILVSKSSTAKSLNDKLNSAEAAYHRNNMHTANNILNAYINQVQAKTSKDLTSSQADILINLANALKR